MQWTIYIHKFTALKFLEPGNRPHFPFFLHKFITSVLNRKVWHFDTVFHKKTLRLSQSFFLSQQTPLWVSAVNWYLDGCPAELDSRGFLVRDRLFVWGFISAVQSFDFNKLMGNTHILMEFYKRNSPQHQNSFKLKPIRRRLFVTVPCEESITSICAWLSYFALLLSEN